MGRAAFTQADVQRAVAGALKGGMPIGSFEVVIDGRGVRILPASTNASNDDDLDAEIRRLIDGEG